MTLAPGTMEPKLHELDPKGDTLLILRNANAPFAVSAPSNTGSQQNRLTLGSAAGKPEVRMRLSARHLTLASAYFQKLTANEWKETTTEGDYSYVVSAEDWDEQALLILMEIIHGKTAGLSMSMDLETVAKLCALVDYYQCHEALKFFIQLWLPGIDKVSYTGRNLLLRLSISCVYPDAPTFQRLTATLIKENAMNMQRQTLISKIIVGLGGLVKAECSDNGLGCTFECSSVFIGALTKGMDKMRLSPGQLQLPPYTGYSLATLQQGILGIKEPSWDRFCGSRNHYSYRQPCSLTSKTKPMVDLAPEKRTMGRKDPSSRTGKEEEYQLGNLKVDKGLPRKTGILQLNAMEPKFHDLDPNGDTLLILRNPNAPFLVHAPPASPPQKHPKLESTCGEPEVRMRLSSKHLMLASAYFQKSMNAFKNTVVEGEYSYTINAQDYDENALLILMNIIHGKTGKLPLSVNHEILAKISLLVDYYQCHGAVRFFNATWLNNMDEVSEEGKDPLYKFCISWVFSDAEAFLHSTAAFIKTSREPLGNLGLPIPQQVIGESKGSTSSTNYEVVSSLTLATRLP
ncbi:hypothetical protein MKX07_004607 [Trichoderma sp. CBMAI-0711]|nr:hypothetical protein MKX07_004607 [Trichoderma sp. CBMAI-0711]